MKSIVIILTVFLFIFSSSWAFWYFYHSPKVSLTPIKPTLRPVAVLPVASASASPKFWPQLEVTFPLAVEDGYKIGLFYQGINNARDLVFSPEGILLVSSPADGKVYALSVENNQVKKYIVVSHLSKPHGLAFYNHKLFIAENNKLSRYLWDANTKQAVFEKQLIKLPSGGHEAHTLVFNDLGELFVKIGSSCNVCQENDLNRAVVIKTDQDGTTPQIVGKGLRNAAFMAINPVTGQIWLTENGRDNLGDQLPPDEINILQSGKNYGWPFCYGDQIRDDSFNKSVKYDCQQTQTPAFQFPAHVAPLGLAFINDDLLVALHGSWNSSVPVGYKVVRLKVAAGKVVGMTDFITGFIQKNSVKGRPVDIVGDDEGNFFVSDDKSGSIYLVSKK